MEIADQLEQNKRETLKCLFGIARQSKKNTGKKKLVKCHASVVKDGKIKVSLEDKMEE